MVLPLFLWMVLAAISTPACVDGAKPDSSTDEGRGAGQGGDGETDSGGDNDSDSGADSERETGAPPSLCGEEYVPVAVPAPFTTLRGFSGAEDFAFDDEGFLVSNREGSLTKQSKLGDERLFVPDIANETSGMVYLADGSLVVASVDEGSLLKVAESGSYTTLMSNLAFPNGVEADQDGFVYVSDQDFGHVIKVDAATSESEVIASELYAPNGLSFDPTFSTLFVGSFGGGTIHALTRTESGPWYKQLFGWVPGSDPSAPCEDKGKGEPCRFKTMDGTCQTEKGLLVCEILSSSCDGKQEGDACAAWGAPGVCRADSAGSLYCEETLPCDGKEEGDECDAWGAPGVCEDTDLGDLECAPRPACEGKEVGDPCEEWDMAGTCQDYGEAELVCEYLLPCDGKEAGDPCEAWGAAGVCSYMDGYVECVTEAEGGGLDGLTVDACGYVYATEFITGIVWRFSPDGNTVEKLLDPGSTWIPNLHFGVGIGGWDAESLYISDRDEGRIFEVPLGVRGRPDIYPTRE